MSINVRYHKNKDGKVRKTVRRSIRTPFGTISNSETVDVSPKPDRSTKISNKAAIRIILCVLIDCLALFIGMYANVPLILILVICVVADVAIAKLIK